MEFFLFAVIVLFILAISDLIVGVSNDAVNFLNSAIGSKVATHKTIMIVVSLGVLIGVTFSSGMMEVARKGIFNPQFFYFSEVMVILLAVMITDIFLLDLFNTFGMPTSTTVSIVFELLGAAVAMAFLKIIADGSSLDTLGQYINSSSAIIIISSILLSVIIAFVVGLFIMYISRVLFSFNYKKNLKSVGVIWTGLAFTMLTYFLLFKGLKGASFVSTDFVQWVNDNIRTLVAVTFLFWTSVMAIVHYVFHYNVLKLVVLFGTFSLAMAFAGNDLVNFIGVPMAGLESYKIWLQSDTDANKLLMGSLSEAVRTDTYLLLIAGGVMILTLWFSKKAKSVTETEINLGRQDEGTEKFSSNYASRLIVGGSMTLSSIFKTMVPRTWRENLEKRFEPLIWETPEEKPAFDLVRASINLTGASMLIALATSLKLPLSTTYVSFMVAMGTSLADRAWGRDSAVYRVAGVLNVIGGWFATALIAFTVAAFNAWIIYQFKIYGVIFLLLVLAFLIIKSFAHHKKLSAKSERMAQHHKDTTIIDAQSLVISTADQIEQTLNMVNTIYDYSIMGLLEEDHEKVKKAKIKLEELIDNSEEYKSKLFSCIKRLQGDNDAARLYLLVYDLEQDILQSTMLIVESCHGHVTNYLTPLDKEQMSNLHDIREGVSDFLGHVTNLIKTRDFKKLDIIKQEKDFLFADFENDVYHQMKGIRENKYGYKNSMLLFSLELETKDLIAIAARFLKLLDSSSKDFDYGKVG